MISRWKNSCEVKTCHNDSQTLRHQLLRKSEQSKQLTSEIQEPKEDDAPWKYVELVSENIPTMQISVVRYITNGKKTEFNNIFNEETVNINTYLIFGIVLPYFFLSNFTHTIQNLRSTKKIVLDGVDLNLRSNWQNQLYYDYGQFFFSFLIFLHPRIVQNF